MKMQKKIFSTFLLVIAIPTIIFFFLIVEISTKMIEKRTISASELVVKESVKRIDTLLNNYRKASMQIYYNQNIIDLLERYTLNGYPLEDDLNMMDEILGGMVNADKYLMSVVLKTDDSLIIKGSKSIGIENYIEEHSEECRMMPGRLEWLPSREMKTVYGLDAFYFGAMRMIRKNGKELGILLFLIREEFFDDIYAGSIPDNSGKDLVLARDGTVISSHDYNIIGKPFATDKFNEILSGKFGTSGSYRTKSGKQKSYLIFSESEESGWYFIREIEEKVVLSGIIRIRQSLFAIIILFSSFLVFLSYFFSSNLSRPVNDLVEYIDGIGPETLGCPPQKRNTASDEIAMLYERLSVMSSRIESLVNEVSKNERLKTQAELKALRNHISPHFIYNTLDTIRWMAVINRQENIREMVSALDRLMRYAADYETSIITLNEEIEIINEYVLIQRMRYSDIELITEIPQEAGILTINKFTLQTIVENSIIHGFRDYKTTGTIKITAKKKNELLILIVEDNGKGFDPEKIKNDNLPHTGLKSVDLRIKLNYGEEYGLILQSTPGKGTIVEIRLPAENTICLNR